jgi:hypothetical protein
MPAEMMSPPHTISASQPFAQLAGIVSASRVASLRQRAMTGIFVDANLRLP